MSYLIDIRDFEAVAKAAAVGISRGDEMLAWWNSRPQVSFSELPGSNPGARMRCFFTTMPINGASSEMMGCLQTATFGRRAATGQQAVSLAEWVSDNFLQKCCWTNKNGNRGGFLYRPVMVLDKGGSAPVRRVDESLKLKINELGSRYEWAAVRLDVLDYIRAFPVVGEFSEYLEWLNREAGYMVLHPKFFNSTHPPPEGCVEEYCFAYSVSPWTVMPTITAYGPGRFHAAFKQFRFFLLNDGSVSIEVLFLVTPRCEQVLDIGGVDPVFGMARLFDLFTLGLGRVEESVKIGVSNYAIGHHARVHNNLLYGMRKVWEGTNWQPPVRQVAGD